MKSNEVEVLDMLACVHRSRPQAGQMQEDVIPSFYSSNVSIPHLNPPTPHLAYLAHVLTPAQRTSPAPNILSMSSPIYHLHDVESHTQPHKQANTHTRYGKMFSFFFLIPCARPTRHREAFSFLDNQGSICSLRSRAS